MIATARGVDGVELPVSELADMDRAGNLPWLTGVRVAVQPESMAVALDDVVVGMDAAAVKRVLESRPGSRVTLSRAGGATFQTAFVGARDLRLAEYERRYGAWRASYPHGLRVPLLGDTVVCERQGLGTMIGTLGGFAPGGLRVAPVGRAGYLPVAWRDVIAIRSSLDPAPDIRELAAMDSAGTLPRVTEIVLTSPPETTVVALDEVTAGRVGPDRSARMMGALGLALGSIVLFVAARSSDSLGNALLLGTAGVTVGVGAALLLLGTMASR